MRRGPLLWAASGLAALATLLVIWQRPFPFQRPSANPPAAQGAEDTTRGPSPREGPGPHEGEDMDAAHRDRMVAFPAVTAGRGGQPLPFRLEDGVKVFEIETRVVQWEVEPQTFREAWTYGGTVPGPELRVTEGDRVRVIVHNRLPESTSVHFHGQFMQGENAMDGVTYLTQDPIKPGARFTYEFTAAPSGTMMYHSHHNSTEQVAKGMLGPFIVEPKTPPKVRWDREVTLVLNDGPLGYTINGKSFPATEPIRAKLGERVLIRWMHEGAMLHPMHLHGMTTTVLAKDGYELAAPQHLDVLQVGPGDRWDTLVVANNPGKWALHCHVLPHAEGPMGMFGLTTVFEVEP